MEHLCDREGLDPHHGGTTEDGAITVQEAQCLGLLRPGAVRPGGRRGDTVGPLTLDDADRLVDELRDAPAPSELWR